LLNGTAYDLVLTHGPQGEYTRNQRHEECCRAVVSLWRSGRMETKRLWMFAYEDGGRAYLPRVRHDADRRGRLAGGVWREKRHLITDIYGFAPGSWEVKTAPKEEGFWCFDSAQAAAERIAPWERQS
jgi:hypothetical protein